jgi:hypothetical protein
MSELMVVSALDTPRIGREYDKVPPHLTLAPWFNLPDESWDYFDDEMGEIILRTKFSPTEAGDAVSYGPKGEDKAHRLNHPDEFTLMHLFPVHAAVFELAHYFDPNIDTTYARLDYSPHISDTVDFALKTGELVDLTNLTVFEKRAKTGRKLVRAVYLWDKIHG